MSKYLLRIFAVCVMPVVFAFGCSDDPSDANAPTLTLDVSAEETYSTGDEIVIHMTATDPQDEDLEFEAVEKPDAADFRPYRNEALFNWAPNAGDITDGDPHRLVFAVTNESDLRTERTVRIHIEGQQGTRFLNSSSQLFNPAAGQALRFNVEVDHPSEPQVVLAMPDDRAPDGASFQQIDDFEGEFQWSPTPSQLDQRTHTVVFEADDGSEIAEQVVTIIVQDTSSGSPDPGGETEAEACAEPDPIDHDPIEVGTGAGSYEITGTITDDSHDWDQAILYWTFDDPLGEDPQFETAEMALEGTTVAGKLANPLVDPGETVEVSYTFCVFDEDADEDGFICAPREFYHRFIAYSPDDDGCIDDGLDMSEPGSGGSISAVAWEAYRTCEGAPKYHAVDIFEGETAEIVISYPPGRSPDLELEHDGEPVDLEVLSCLGLAYAEIEQPGTAQLRVAADHFPYHVTAFIEDPDAEECDYANSTGGDARIVVDDFVMFDDERVCAVDDRDIYAMELLPGDFFEALAEFSHDDGDIDLTLYAPWQSDEVDDAGEGVAQAWSTDDDEYLDYTVEDAGFHYLAVDTYDQPNSYDLLLGRQCGSDDMFAGNHSLEEAGAVDFDTYFGLKLCSGESDWYEYTNDTGDEIDVDGQLAVIAGDIPELSIGMYEEDGSDWPVDRGIVDDDNDAFYATVDPGQSLFVEVETTADVYYELHLEEGDF